MKSEPMVHYAHESEPEGVRFKQYAKDPLPPWAVDVQPYTQEAPKITFSVNNYDKDGDVCDEGIFLHFGNTRIKVAQNAEEFKVVASTIQNIANEITENFS